MTATLKFNVIRLIRMQINVHFVFQITTPFLEVDFQTIYSIIIHDTKLLDISFILLWFLSLREIFFSTLQWYFCSNLVLSIHIWRQGDPRLDVLDLVYHLIWIFWKWNKNCYDLEGSSMHINEIEMINEKLYL